jgi:ABC-type uncharacterized transport system substrate-binding protein
LVLGLGLRDTRHCTKRDPSAIVHCEAIITLAAQHRLPAVYPYRFFVTSGGLITYGLNNVEQFRLAAGYVARILKGEKPADLPVQAPTNYELVIISRVQRRSALKFRLRCSRGPTK